jgi:hypothetical protein
VSFPIKNDDFPWQTVSHNQMVSYNSRFHWQSASEPYHSHRNTHAMPINGKLQPKENFLQQEN